MVSASRLVDSVWEDAARRVATQLDDVGAAVVVGHDARITALAALGLARAQASRRRVAVADLLGEAEPIQSLVSGDDPHGIIDSFIYGVSLNRIARQVDGQPNLFILPSGTEPVVQEEVIRSARWKRLAGGFQEVGALLLVAATDDAPGLEDLIANTDGAIVIGTDVLLGPDVRTIVNIVPRRVSPPIITPERAVPAVESIPDVAPVIPAPTAASPRRSRAWPTWATLAIGGAVGLIAVALARRGAESGSEQPAPPAAALAPAAPATADSATIPLVVSNPADSARAAAWSVAVKAFNVEASALRFVKDSQRALPVATYAPTIHADDARWYQVYSGALASRAAADSLLVSLRRGKTLQAGEGEVVRVAVPLALRLMQGIAGDAAGDTVKSLIERGVPAYALVQDDGSSTIYAGAFESPEQATLLSATMRSAQVEFEVAYRTGRSR